MPGLGPRRNDCLLVMIHGKSGLLSRNLNLITLIWEFPKIGVPLLGVSIIRAIVYWVLYWGPSILGNYHIGM